MQEAAEKTELGQADDALNRLVEIQTFVNQALGEMRSLERVPLALAVQAAERAEESEALRAERDLLEDLRIDIVAIHLSSQDAVERLENINEQLDIIFKKVTEKT